MEMSGLSNQRVWCAKMKPFRVGCYKCKRDSGIIFTEHEILRNLTGTPGYYLSTVGRGVSKYLEVRCKKCGYTRVADFGTD